MKLSKVKAGKCTAPKSGKYPKRKLNPAIHLEGHKSCPDVANNSAQVFVGDIDRATCFFCKPYNRSAKTNDLPAAFERANRASFTMKGHSKELVNTYWCDHCKGDGKEHEVIDDGPADYHFRKCTCCRRQDGPWCKASHHWSGGFL